MYHNPRCSKSRQTKDLLEKRGEKPQLVHYLDNPLSSDELIGVMKKLGKKGSEIVRFKESLAAELGLSSSEDKTDEEWAQILAEYPQLLERPIVVRGERAVVGRPPENVLELLD